MITNNAKSALIMPLLALGIYKGLGGLLESLKAVKWEIFSDQQVNEITRTLEHLHSSLVKLLSAKKRIQFYNGIEERTEDLRDIIEMLALRNSQDFSSLIAECASSLSI